MTKRSKAMTAWITLIMIVLSTVSVCAGDAARGSFFVRDIIVNGEDIVNYNLQYPFFLYEGVTYFPLTDDMKDIFGFETELDWEARTLKLKKTAPSLNNIRENWTKNNAEAVTLEIEADMSLVVSEEEGGEEAIPAVDPAIKAALDGIMAFAPALSAPEEEALEAVDLGESPILIKGGVIYLPLRPVADSGALGWDLLYDSWLGICVSTKDGVAAQSFFPTARANYNRGLADYIRSKNKSLSEDWAQELVFMFHRAAEVNQIDEKLLIAVAQKESRFAADAVSKSGASGIMQIMPETGAGYGLSPEQLLDAKTSIDYGAAYLNGQMEKFEGNTGMALSAYNQGARSVSRGAYSRGYSENIQAILAGIDAHMEAGGYASPE
jgi:hypothetical protein